MVLGFKIHVRVPRLNSFSNSLNKNSESATVGYELGRWVMVDNRERL